MTARSGAERQKACDDRKRKAGYKQIRNLWCRPEAEKYVRKFARELSEKMNAVDAAIAALPKGKA